MKCLFFPLLPDDLSEVTEPAAVPSLSYELSSVARRVSPIRLHFWRILSRLKEEVVVEDELLLLLPTEATAGLDVRTVFDLGRVA